MWLAAESKSRSHWEPISDRCWPRTHGNDRCIQSMVQRCVYTSVSRRRSFEELKSRIPRLLKQLLQLLNGHHFLPGCCDIVQIRVRVCNGLHSLDEGCGLCPVLGKDKVSQQELCCNQRAHHLHHIFELVDQQRCTAQHASHSQHRGQRAGVFRGGGGDCLGQD